jgi:hypothetical protein
MEKELVKNLFFVSFVLALTLTACGATPPPTVDASQVQASALAVASTMYAMTQAAIPPTFVPSDTPVPSPTDMPSPTPLTLLPITTDTPFALQNPTSVPSTDSCNGPLVNKPKAAPDAGKIGTNIKITNSTKASITVSLFLNKNKQGECGFKSYTLTKSSSITIANALPFGCYSISAFVNDPKKPTSPSYGSCVNITGVDKTTITVLADSIKVTGP